MKERASLAGASGWLRLFNALINPLLKAMQRVSGFVLWPRDYSAINKGWAGNIDEIPPPQFSSALCLFSNKKWDRDDMQLEICQRKSTLVYMSECGRRTLVNTCMCTCCARDDPSDISYKAHVINHPHWLETHSLYKYTHHPWKFFKKNDVLLSDSLFVFNQRKKLFNVKVKSDLHKVISI